jgi:hypothetical protein
MRLPQLAVALAQALLARLVLQAIQLTLQADKLPARIALVFQPVGQDQAVAIIVRLVLAGAQEGDHLGAIGGSWHDIDLVPKAVRHRFIIAEGQPKKGPGGEKLRVAWCRACSILMEGL